jgi:flagellar export protein FliJ
MARFAFNLEPVLQHRDRLEKEQQVHLAVALTRVREAERYRDALLRRREDMRERLREYHAGMDVVELRATYAHCDFLDREIVNQEAVIERVRADAEDERAKLVTKTMDKKVLETLKTRRREIFDIEVASDEQRTLDDINARIFDRALRHRETPS